MLPPKKQKLTKELVHLIIAHAGPLFNVDPDAILGRRRTERIANARFAAIWVAGQVSFTEFADLGTQFDRDRTGIIYILKQVIDRRSINPDFKAKSDALLDVIRLEIKAKET